MSRHRVKAPVQGAADLDAIFSALSSPTRRAILTKLSKGESTVTELAAPFDMSLPAISKHLSVLEEAGVIRKVKEGRTYRCRIAPAPLRKANRWIEGYERLWNRQLDQLAEFLNESSDGGP